jgi:CRISPR-associated protein Cas2
MKFNGWRNMWIMAAFDLPTATKEQRQQYTMFRDLLLKNGFTMMQFSVYIRNMPTLHKAEAMVSRIGKLTPEKGKCSFIMITDKQYGMTKNFYGSSLTQEKIPKKYEQLLLFGDF